jgi:hypothetical protein
MVLIFLAGVAPQRQSARRSYHVVVRGYVPIGRTYPARIRNIFLSGYLIKCNCVFAS